jgi:hypothetical protein
VLKDKAWFFGSYMEERERWAGAPSQSNPLITPTPNGIKQLQTAFPNSPGVAALNTIGPTAITAGNPTFSNLQTVNVTANGIIAPIEFGNVSRNVPGYYNDREASGRVDWQVTNKDRFYGQYYNNNNGAGSSAAMQNGIGRRALQLALRLDF